MARSKLDAGILPIERRRWCGPVPAQVSLAAATVTPAPDSRCAWTDAPPKGGPHAQDLTDRQGSFVHSHHHGYCHRRIRRRY